MCMKHSSIYTLAEIVFEPHASTLTVHRVMSMECFEMGLDPFNRKRREAENSELHDMWKSLSPPPSVLPTS